MAKWSISLLYTSMIIVNSNVSHLSGTNPKNKSSSMLKNIAKVLPQHTAHQYVPTNCSQELQRLTQVNRPLDSIHKREARSLVQLADLDCHATADICNVTARHYNHTSRWRKFCFLDRGEVKVCSLVCSRDSPEYRSSAFCRLRCPGE